MSFLCGFAEIICEVNHTSIARRPIISGRRIAGVEHGIDPKNIDRIFEAFFTMGAASIPGADATRCRARPRRLIGSPTP
jgi:hypothetical protein